jgi:opacity protein-like surface antigen
VIETGNPSEARRESMRNGPFPQIAWIAAAAALWAAGPVQGSELYVSGELGVSQIAGEGEGTNDLVGVTNPGDSEDASPIWGGGLGAVFPLNAMMPWRMRLPSFGVPYWPGQEVRFHGGEDVRFPDWKTRFEIEYMRGRDAELTTPSFNPLDAYRSDVKTWTVMGKMRLDVPIRAPIDALFGRVPFLEPVTIYMGGGLGMAFTDLAVSTGLLAGDDDASKFAWQGIAGIGYQLNDRVTLSMGWRYHDLGHANTQLFDAASQMRGRYSIDLSAHEFTSSLSIWFWQLPPLLGEE